MICQVHRKRAGLYVSSNITVYNMCRDASAIKQLRTVETVTAQQNNTTGVNGVNLGN